MPADDPPLPQRVPVALKLGYGTAVPAIAAVYARCVRRKAPERSGVGALPPGWPQERIGSHLGISRSTVYLYLRSEAFPERRHQQRARHSHWKRRTHPNEPRL
jgi:hypothetical protein